MHTPIGGISFITNVLIVSLGALVRFVNGGDTRTLLVSQENINALEGSRFGVFFSRTLAYAIPLSIFSLIFTLSAITLTRLYQDEEKFTVIDIAAIVAGRSVAGAGVLREKLIHADDSGLFPKIVFASVIATDNTTITYSIPQQ
jgi:hypothetical protein